MDYHLLLQQFEELQAKYSNVKRHYFERDAQVIELQNTVAAQRRSISEASLNSVHHGSDSIDSGIGDETDNVDPQFGSTEQPLHGIDNCTTLVRGLFRRGASVQDYDISELAKITTAEKHVAQLIDERSALYRELEEKKLEQLRFNVEACRLMKENVRLRNELAEFKRQAR